MPRKNPGTLPQTRTWRGSKEHDDLRTYHPRAPLSVPSRLRAWAGQIVTVNGWYLDRLGWWGYVVEAKLLVHEEELHHLRLEGSVK